MEELSIQRFGRIQTSKNLPSLPHILLKLIELCHSEESQLNDLSQIINLDTSLSANVMKMANSSYYGGPKRATNIEQALTILGKNTIKDIAIGQAFSQEADTAVLELKVFWRHSLMCAILSRLIATKILYPSPDEAFLAGLLHDIGKLVLWVNFPKEYAELFRSAQFRPDLILAEETLHGATHCDIGAWLIRRWSQQSFMADAVLYHHEPLDRIQDAFPLIKIIYVGNILCPETDQDKTVKLHIAQNILGLEMSEVEEITRQAEKEVRATARSIGLDIDTLVGYGRKIPEKDLKKQEDLIKELQDIALFQGTFQNLLEAPDEDSILQTVQQSLDILFDIKQALFFLYESENNVLVGKSVSSKKQYDMINQVTIPFQKEKSLLIESLLCGDPLDSYSDPIKDKHTIIDEQIIRLAANEGILCLPMTAYKQYMGVIVLGLTESRFSNLTAKMRPLRLFAKQAALALYANGYKQSQAQAALSERPGIPSQLVRKVAYEIDTPLSIIKNYLAVLRGKLSEDETCQAEIRILKEEIDSVVLIISELAEPSKLKVQPKDILDLNTFISNLTTRLQEALILAPDIKVHWELDSLLPKIMTDKNKLKQIFWNLIMNAAQAMPEEGNLNIRTRHVFNYITAKMDASIESTWGHAEVTITDDGYGLVETAKPSLFEPHVTSKGAGHARLRLGIAYKHVKELKGILTDESDNQKGVSFKTVIPVAYRQEN